MKYYRQYLQRVVWSLALLLLPAVCAIAQPAVATKSATNVSCTTATLNATINTNGTATSYMFAYGTSKSYGKATAVTSLSASSGTQKISVEISKLSPNTTYHFCIKANHKGGAVVNGEDLTFTTSSIGALPTSITLDATDIETESATLNGRINPNGTKANYCFEYGTTAQMGNATTVHEISEGTSFVKVAFPISDLTPETTYFFRLKTANTKGTATSEVLTFTTKAKEIEYPSNPIKASDSVLNFGEVTVGNTHMAPYTLTNDSQFDVDIAAPSVSSPFSVDWNGGTLKANETKSITVTFAPTAQGEASGSLQFDCTCGNKKQTVVLNLNGIGKEPEPEPEPEPDKLSISVDSIDFDTLAPGSSASRTVTITNNSDNVVRYTVSSISSYSIVGNTFHYEGQISGADILYKINPGESTDFTFVYAPEQDCEGDKDYANYNVEVIGTDEIHKLYLTGKCVKEPEPEPEPEPEVDDQSCLVVWHKDGSKVMFKLNDEPKITFDKDNVIIDVPSSTFSYEVAKILKMTYDLDPATDVESMMEAQGKEFSRNGESLNFIADDKDLHVRIVAANGVVVREFEVERGNAGSIRLAELVPGVYLVNVNDVTYKINVR